MTFLNDLKKQIVSTPLKNSCCIRSMLNGIVLAKGKAESGVISVSLENEDALKYTEKLVREVFGQTVEVKFGSNGGRRRELFFRSPSMEKQLRASEEGVDKMHVKKCASCDTAFMSGIFLAAGRMTSIDSKCARLEIASSGRADLLFDYFSENGLVFSRCTRRNERLLYTANSSLIEDFFASLGLNSAAFAIMNKKIEKEFINNTNRQINCVMNNISKTVAASAKVLEAIKALKEANLLSTMPEELENTAILRLQYPDYSLARLAAQFTPPISKPGLSHRLNKIIEFADKALEKRED